MRSPLSFHRLAPGKKDVVAAAAVIVVAVTYELTAHGSLLGFAGSLSILLA